MKRIDDRSFYQRDPKLVAKELLGKIVHHSVDGMIISGMITETEAYESSGDLAAHNAVGMTKRTEPLFLDGGHLYLYKIHTHICMDIVTETVGTPSSVLIRSLEPVEGIDQMRINRGNTPVSNLTTGPGKLTKALGIPYDYNRIDICDPLSPFLLFDTDSDVGEIIETTRIGISKAVDMKNRFYLKDSEFISRR